MNNKLRKICIVTTTRAEYGIMSNLIKKIELDDTLELQLFVSGTHLSGKFGNTYQEITSPITKKIDIEIEKEPSHSMALAIEKFSSAFSDLIPDLILILGDRYEILAVAIAAMLNNIPIAHIHGGETTEGAIDEAIRHSITKMSHLHFATCEEYKKRIIQLGENPERVFNVGSLGVENIKNFNLLSKVELEKELGFKFDKKNLLVTYHPVTLENTSTEAQFKELLNALSKLQDTRIIFTKPNSDSGNQAIIELIDKYVINNSNAVAFTSMGALRYLSTMQFVDAVVGNSSSGIIEAPSFKIATINIGDRQKGRIQANSVINCLPDKQNILSAINKIYTKDFKKTLIKVKNPYKQIHTSDKLIEVLKITDMNNILKKSFYNLG